MGRVRATRRKILEADRASPDLALHPPAAALPEPGDRTANRIRPVDAGALDVPEALGITSEHAPGLPLSEIGGLRFGTERESGR